MFMRNTDHYSVKCFSIWVCLMPFHVWSKVMHICSKDTKEISYVFLAHHIQSPVMSIGLVSVGVDFQHLVKVVSDRFLHCEVTIFLL